MEKYKTISIRLLDEQHFRLKELAKKQDISIKHLILMKTGIVK